MRYCVRMCEMCENCKGHSCQNSQTAELDQDDKDNDCREWVGCFNIFFKLTFL